MLVGSACAAWRLSAACASRSRARWGAYAEASNQEMLTATLAALVERYRLKGATLGDVGAGAVLKHSRDFGLTRECVLDCGLARETPAFDLQACLRHEPGHCDRHRPEDRDGTDRVAASPRASTPRATCRWSTRIRTAASCCAARAASRSARGCRRGSDCDRATSNRSCRGGRAAHWPVDGPELRAMAGPGRSCAQSRINSRWKVTRKAAAAYDEGFFDDLVVEFRGLKRDNNVRRDSSLEKLAALKPSFDRQGTLTAGNSTPMTDGAAAVLLASEEWAKRALPVLVNEVRQVRGSRLHRQGRSADGARVRGAAHARRRGLEAAGLSISTRSTRRSKRRCCARSKRGSRRSSAATGSGLRSRSARSIAAR